MGATSCCNSSADKGGACPGLPADSPDVASWLDTSMGPAVTISTHDNATERNCLAKVPAIFPPQDCNKLRTRSKLGETARSDSTIRFHQNVGDLRSPLRAASAYQPQMLSSPALRLLVLFSTTGLLSHSYLSRWNWRISLPVHRWRLQCGMEVKRIATGASIFSCGRSWSKPNVRTHSCWTSVGVSSELASETGDIICASSSIEASAR